MSSPTDYQKTGFAFFLIAFLFFLWGFAHNLDPILIPHLKRSFALTTTQSTLVDSSVFIAYFLMALPAGLAIKKWGYQNTIILGLLLFSVGCFLFIPAANLQSYSFFLVALFIIACGLTFLETAANPYASALGSPETSTQRLNLAQSFNGLATALAPVIGARLILTKGYSDTELSAMSEGLRVQALASEASSVKLPYLVLGVILLLIAIVFKFIKLPQINYTASLQQKSQSIFHAFKHRHLTWAVTAQFFYVGAQVCIFSLFILYATQAASLSEIKAADYLGVCGIAFLIGRFLGTFFMRFIAPNRLLTLYAGINVFLCLIAIMAQGLITVYAIVLICFFMSIMFPTIFALGIKDLGMDTEYGSSLIIMSIVGGALLPRLFGYLSDATGSIQLGYFVPLLSFIVIVIYGLYGYKSTSSKTDTEQPVVSLSH